MIAFHENAGDQRLKAVGGLDQALYHQAVSIAVDNEPGQKIAFGIDPTAEQRIDTQSLAQNIGGSETVMEERLVDCNVSAAQKTKRDLRLRAEKRLPQNRSALIANGHDAAGLGLLRVQNITPVNPEMAAPDAVRSALANDDLGGWEGWTGGFRHR